MLRGLQAFLRVAQRGRWIAFKGQRTDGQKFELGMVDARGAKQGLITRLEGEVTPNIGWSHDSSRIFFSQKTADRGNRVQLHTVEANTKEPPQLLPGQILVVGQGLGSRRGVR